MSKAYRWLAGTAAVSAVASMLIGAPAQASDETCGAWKTVRVSINYRACTLTKNGALKAEGYFRNNHGSPVTIDLEAGYSYQGGSVKEIVEYDEVTIPTNDSTFKVYGPLHCGSSRLAVSVYDNNTGKWGTWSYDAERDWSC